MQFVLTEQDAFQNWGRESSPPQGPGPSSAAALGVVPTGKICSLKFGTYPNKYALQSQPSHL